MTEHTATAGRPSPLGATFDGDGVNFAVFSHNAHRMTLCLFSEDGKTEVEQLDLPERDGEVFHGYVSGLRPGQLYGYRAHGPFEPEQGHRFNHHKLLIDPYAKRLTGHPDWHDALMAYEVGHEDADLSFDERDSAPYMPRCVIEDPAFSWGDDRHPRTPTDETVIYEAHVKGLTMQHPGVDRPGTFLGMASDPILEHLTNLGITAVELLPAQAFLNDRFLTDQGLTLGLPEASSRPRLPGPDQRVPADGVALPPRRDRGLQPHRRGQRGRRWRSAASTMPATTG